MAYKSLIRSPKTLSIMLTYTCPAECKNCGTLSSPRSKENISLEDAKRYILDASDKDFRVVVFTGGEATLRWGDLLEGIGYASSLGLATRLVTNAHWANRADQADKKVKLLKEAGLNEINFSTGDEHSRFIPLERIGIAVRAAVSQRLPAFVMVETKKNRAVTKDTVLELPDLRALSPEEMSMVSISESPWMPLDPLEVEDYEEGMAAGQNDVEARKPCHSVLTTLTLQADGKVSPCCGLGIRQLPELMQGKLGDSIEHLQRKAESDLVKLAIHYYGPLQLVKLAADVDPTIKWEGMYSHHCQACARLYTDGRVIKALKSRVEQIQNMVYEAVILDEGVAPGFIRPVATVTNPRHGEERALTER